MTSSMPAQIPLPQGPGAPSAQRVCAREAHEARLLTAEELAERWQVRKAHVYRLTREGLLPTVKLGRYCRYRVAAVEAWEQGGGVAAND